MALSFSGVAQETRLCVEACELMCSKLRILDGEELDGISYGRSCDARDRFMIWAGNIGALQHKSVPTSLDHRLRNAAEIAKHVVSLLGSLKRALNGGKAVLKDDDFES
jgi:hypothetical protein